MTDRDERIRKAAHRCADAIVWKLFEPYMIFLGVLVALYVVFMIIGV